MPSRDHRAPAIPCRPFALQHSGWKAIAASIVLLSSHAALAQTAPGSGPPPAVTTVAVEARDIAPTTEFIERVEAIQSFEALPRVEGFLREVAFSDGQDVKAGQLLYTIEPAPYEAALASARAQVSRAKANLLQAQANYQRTEELRGRGNVSEAQLDEATAARDVAQADVLAAQAAVQTAELNLGYTRIASPIDGRIGVTAVTVGNLVSPGSGPLANVVQLDPIRVVFSVSDRDLLAVRQQYEGLSPQELVKRYVPKLRLPNGGEYREEGRVEFVDNRVDPATGTIAVRAVFPNPQQTLLPGQFVTALIRPERSERRPVVPVAAVQQDREGHFVLVLDQQNRVGQRRIQVGPQIEQAFAVESGLQEGETVILGGVQKVRPGITVQPSPASDQTASQP
jgi:membrane fusion protein (multidrug efflux system)